MTGNPDGTGRTPFADKRIPASRISPIARTILNFLPPTTRSGLTTNFEKPTSQSKSIDQFDVKTDYVIGPSDRMSVRYSFQRATVFDPGLYGPNGGIYGGPHNSGFQGSGPSRNQSPGLLEIDSSVFRKFRITERWNVELRGESFNLSNTPHFDRPGTVFGNASFGQVTTARGTQSVQVNENRQIQFSLRLAF